MSHPASGTKFQNDTQISDSVILETWNVERNFLTTHEVRLADIDDGTRVCPCPEAANLELLDVEIHQIGGAETLSFTCAGFNVNACTTTFRDGNRYSVTRVAGHYLVGVSETVIEQPEWNLSWEMGSVMLARLGKPIQKR